MFRRTFAALSLTAGLLFSTAAGTAEQVTVFAAASLKNALDEAISAFSGATGTKVVASYAASSALAKQIEAGAPADLFFSADISWMDYLAERDLIDTAGRTDLLGNTLVLVAARSNSIGNVAIGKDLDLPALLGDGRLAVGQVDSVPAGKYARAALEHLGLWWAVVPKLAQSDNVRAALALVARGEAPLGIVYATDAAAESGVEVVGTFPDGSHPPIIYPVALVKSETASTKAQAFLAYLKGADATAAFRKAGFKLLHPPAS